MPSNVILECSQYESSSTNTAVWTNTFTDVTLEEGDVFELQQCLLNTQTVSSGSINIVEDVEVTIQVAYYEYALGTYNTANGTTASGSADLTINNTPLPYAFVNVKVKKGTEEEELRQISYDKEFSPQNLVTQPWKPYPAGLYLLRQPKPNGDPATDSTTALYTADITVTIPSGVYLPDSIAALISKKVSTQFDASIGGLAGQKGLVVTLTDNAFDNYRMVQLGDAFGVGDSRVDSYTHRVNPDTTNGYRMVGASTFELAFNGSNFSFTNMHTPVMGATGGGDDGQQFYTNPSVGILKTGIPNPALKVVDCYGGCVITDLQPRSFWNQLGFSNTHIDNNVRFNDSTFTATQSAGGDAVAYFNAHRVKPSVLNSDFRSSTVPGINSNTTHVTFGDEKDSGIGGTDDKYQIPADDTMALIATTTTDSLDADLNYIVDSIGYYRIEAVTAISNDFKKQGERLGAVVGIVNTNYSANDFVIGYGDGSSIAYLHSGAAQPISSVSISIIDPLTNQPALGLGANSTVFLQIVKGSGEEKKKGKEN